MPIDAAQLGSHTGYIRDKAYFATAIETDPADLDRIAARGVEITNDRGTLYRFIQRNKVKRGDRAEMISPSKTGVAFDVCELYGTDGMEIESAPHPSMIFWCRVPFEVREGDIMRGAD
jgi:hypothetical protein